jgi:MFS family permease
MTIIGDLFSIEERAKLQGVFSAVWGVVGLGGPLLGGFITDTIGWRWVFFLNLPFGVASMVLVWRYYHERLAKHAHILDYWGSVLLSGSVIALLLALLQGGPSYGWGSPQTLGMLAVSALLLALFVRQEIRAAEPVLPLSLFRNRVIAVSSLAIFVAGGVMFGVTSYVPLVQQGVFGGTATEAGLVLAPMSLAWVVAATVSGKLILRIGYFPVVMAGGTSLVLGAFMLLGVSAETSIMIAAVAGLVMGVGMGFTSNATVIAVQTAVDWSQRGIATASTQFFRTIGGSIAVAIMGGLLNARVAERLAAIPGAPADGRAEVLLNEAERAAYDPAVIAAMQQALSASLHEIFFIVLACAVLCFATLLFFPRGQAAELAAAAPRQEAVPKVAET